MKKPNLLIPLSKNASRGDQILNAKSFKNQGFSSVIYEENLTKDNFIKSINLLNNQKDKYIEKMNISNLNNAIDKIIEQIEILVK